MTPAEDLLADPARLAALDASGLMDSGPEPIFEVAIRLAGRILNSKVNLVSLVDEQRQYFKAERGLEAAAIEDRQTPLTHSFCQHVVRSGDILVVSNARDDHRVKDNPAIDDLGVVAYLGIPISSSDGDVLGSFCAIDPNPREWTEDEIETMRDLAMGVQSEIRLRIEMEKTRRAEELAKSSRDLLSLILESAQDGITMLDGDWRVIYTNQSARDLMRLDKPIEGQIIWDVFRDAEDNPFWKTYHKAFESGEPQTVEAYYPAFDAWFEARCFPREGMLTIFFRDVTSERRRADARQVLVRELDHRIKNVFSIVGAMTSMTARSVTTTGEMAKALQGRFRSLSAAHDLIRPAIRLDSDIARIGEVSFEQLLTTLLRPHLAEGIARLKLSGPYVALGPNAATQFSLVVHELATNAAKYGCLSVPGGSLLLNWTLSSDAIDFVWAEHDGPPISVPPEHKGFGSQLVRMAMKAQLHGHVSHDWREAGLQVEFRIPLSSLDH